MVSNKKSNIPQYYNMKFNSPNISSDTGTRRISPVNSHVVCLASIPDVPSNTLQYTQHGKPHASIKSPFNTLIDR